MTWADKYGKFDAKMKSNDVDAVFKSLLKGSKGARGPQELDQIEYHQLRKAIEPKAKVVPLRTEVLTPFTSPCLNTHSCLGR